MEGVYSSYEGRVILCENQQWMLDKVLVKILIDLFNNNLQNIPNIKMTTTTSLNVPYRAPFKQNKRFPETGKYVRIGVGTVWFTLFEAIKRMKAEELHIHQNLLFHRDIEIPKIIIIEMMEKFYAEEDMFNRESFEKTMNIQWIDDDSTKKI